ncbi:MAG TPA: hypothetical protein VKM55_22920 [Candidatus Lokiarchaeia archaeon]|nr:hypothetical protein [Candidatus Lokiarchaeia archaeon]
MDLPEEPLQMTRKEQEHAMKFAQRSVEKGRKEFEKYVQSLKKQGYSDDEIEVMLD